MSVEYLMKEFRNPKRATYKKRRIEMAKVGSGYQVGLSWIPIQNGQVPPGAIQVDDCIFVARASFEGERIPGKYSSKYKLCYVPYSGNEHSVEECEILCDTSFNGDDSCYKWVKETEGDVPKKAIVAGLASDGQPLYVCKHTIEGEVCVGKVHQGHSCAYVPYGGKEHSCSEYEVLVLRK